MLYRAVATAIAFPASFALVSHSFSVQERGKAIGVWSGCVSLGMALGPLLGGIIVSLWSWHWIFFVNIPIILVGFIIGITLSPITICVAILAIVIGRLLTRINPWCFIIIGLALFMLIAIAFANFPAQGDYAYIVKICILLGIGMGFVSVPASTVAMSTIHKNIVGMASGTLISMRNIGGALSLALIVSVFRQQYHSLLQQKINFLMTLSTQQKNLLTSSIVELKHKGLLLAHLTPNQIDHYHQLYRQMFLQAYHSAMWLLFAVMLFVSIIILLLLKRRSIDE